MNRRAAISRADMARACAKAEDADCPAVARLCGFREAVQIAAEPELSIGLPDIAMNANETPQPLLVQPLSPAPSKLKYLRATHFEKLEELREPPVEVFTPADLAVNYGHVPPSPPALMPYSRLLPYLRRAFGHSRSGSRVDESRYLRAVCRLSPVKYIPRKHCAAWPTEIQLLVDGRPNMAGFSQDVEALQVRLQRQIGRDRCKSHPISGGTPDVPAKRIAPDVPTLAITDMGCLDGDIHVIAAWQRFAARNRSGSRALTVLMPCPRDRWDGALARTLRTICWDKFERLPASARGQRAQVEDATLLVDRNNENAANLLSRLAPALSIEPYLLRAARLAPGPEVLDVGSEYDARFCADVARAGSVFALLPHKRQEYMLQFKALPPETKRAIAEAIKTQHAGYSIAFRLEETLNLVEGGAFEDVTSGDQERPEITSAEVNRRRLRETLEQAIATDRRGAYATDLAFWLDKSVERASEAARSDADVSAAWALSKFVLEGTLDGAPPAGVDPAVVTRIGERLAQITKETPPEARIDIRASRVRIGDVGSESERKSPRLVSLTTNVQVPTVTISETRDTGEVCHRVVAISRERLPATVPLQDPRVVQITTQTGITNFEPWSIPPWATAAGGDMFGDYLELVVNKVLFRFRWISPGQFQMGSREDENGRWDDEPHHNVTITRGFWMGETACTQAQWYAVMRKMPSLFKGDDRPVEQVSWQDCVQFCRRLNQLYPDLHARLPSEAEWEYACRAGTSSAFNDGSNCTEPYGKDPALEGLGWYDVNSGRETHPVKQLKANAWGLYDMHGNVYEWCYDAFTALTTAGVLDPCEIGNAEADRVLRGGSWNYFAGFWRSAFRRGFEPSERFGDLGFRLLTGQPPEAEWQRSATASAERAPKDEAADGAKRATADRKRKR